MKIFSPAFNEGDMIPSEYTCDGDNVSPQLNIEGVPEDAQSLALIVDDPDAPAGTANPGWVHWVVINIDPKSSIFNRNEVPAGGLECQTDFSDKTGYGGPCPPSGTHRYYFKLYALDTTLDLDTNATKSDVESAMKDHVIGQARLMGRYSRQ